MTYGIPLDHMGAIIIKQVKKDVRKLKKNIYVLPFKTMEIMANHFIFIYMNVKEFKP
jgi:hypothetical protein